VLETFKLYSATQCDSDACLIIRLFCKRESPSNQKLVADSYIAVRSPHSQQILVLGSGFSIKDSG